MYSQTRHSIWPLLLLLLAGCGARQIETIGVEEETSLMIVGKDLIGVHVIVGEVADITIRKSQLMKYEFGVLGAADTDIENSNRVLLKLQPGSHRVRIERGEELLHDKTLYFSEGQRRTISLKDQL